MILSIPRERFRRKFDRLDHSQPYSLSVLRPPSLAIVALLGAMSACRDRPASSGPAGARSGSVPVVAVSPPSSGSIDAGTFVIASNHGRRLSAGHSHACFVRADGHVVCWGNNDTGQLGDGTLESRTLPVMVKGISDVLHIAAGENFSCAATERGRIACWGENSHGQLGNGSTEFSSQPLFIAGIEDAVEVAAGVFNACARRRSGQIVCWGSNEHSIVGVARGPQHPVAPTPMDLPASSAGVAVGQTHACARMTDGRLWCWGSNASGLLGGRDPTTRAAWVPGAADAVEVLSAPGGTCVRTRDDGVVCFASTATPLKDVDRGTDLTTPGRLRGIADVAALGLSQTMFCVKAHHEAVKCREYRRDGWSTFADVANTSDVLSLSAAHGYACGLRATGAVVCWGRNAEGQLGDGTHEYRASAVTVRLP